MENITKTEAINNLIKTCEGLLSDKGTIYLSKESLALQNCVRHAIENCFRFGISQDFIDKILIKYGNNPNNQRLSTRENVA